MWYQNCGAVPYKSRRSSYATTYQVLQSHRICACVVWYKNPGAKSSPLQESRIEVLMPTKYEVQYSRRICAVQESPTVQLHYHKVPEYPLVLGLWFPEYHDLWV